MDLIIVLLIVSIFFRHILASNCSSETAQDLASLQAALRQISNHATSNQPSVRVEKNGKLYSRNRCKYSSQNLISTNRAQAPSNMTSSNHLTRRTCLPYLDPETQEFDGTYVCDKDWPEVQLIQGMFRITGLVTNLSLLPAYYTGWTNDQMEDPLWKAYVLNWLWKYTGTTPQNPRKLALDFYWYWNALPTGWYVALFYLSCSRADVA